MFIFFGDLTVWMIMGILYLVWCSIVFMFKAFFFMLKLLPFMLKITVMIAIAPIALLIKILL